MYGRQRFPEVVPGWPQSPPTVVETLNATRTPSQPPNPGRVGFLVDDASRRPSSPKSRLRSVEHEKEHHDA